MKSRSPSNDDTAIPAATVIVFRNGRGIGNTGSPPEILMVIRSRTMTFAGGAAVFPGGRVDPQDYELASRLVTAQTHGFDTDEAAHRIAAIRETLEETGLAIGIREPVSSHDAVKARALSLEHGALEPVLAAMGWTLALDKVVPFARWFPKNEKLTRLFDTRFYLFDVGTGAVDIAVDATENTRLFWTSAADALGAAEREDIAIIYPTRRNLERLAQFGSYTDAHEHAQSIPMRTITPFLTEENGEKWLRIPDNSGYPVTGERLDLAMRG